MNKLTRQELDDRLLDYLYDELEPSERSAFERALPEHPEIAAEVEAHRATRKAYAVLPREVAPPGLLANVLLAAEAEAKRRSTEQVPWWEKLRRVLFQPTFAMAAAVLLVAGISYVSIKKDRLPGMEPANDAQHIPPVAMTAPSQAKAVERAELADDSRAVGEAATGLQEAPAVAPTTPPAPAAAMVAQPEVAANADPSDGKLVKNAPRPAIVSPEPPKAKDLARTPAEPKVTAELAARDEGGKQGLGGELGGLSDGDGVADTIFEADDEAERRPSNAGNVPARAPTEEWVAPAPTTPKPVPDGERKKSDTSTDVHTFDKVTEAPKREEPTKPADSPAKAPATKEAPAGPPPAEVDRKADEVQVTRTVDDSEKRDASPKPATLTPPAPTAETLWATYRKQDTAGAYADALRSIEALAKLEGESTRVKEARAALKSKLATTKSTTTDKVPPDPPVQAPK